MIWRTKDGNKAYLCNFSLQVVGVKEVRFDGVGERITYVMLYLDFGEDPEKERKIHDIPLLNIDKTDWRQLDSHCCYAPEVADSKVKRYLNFIVHEQLEKADRKLSERLTHVGMYKIEGKPVFCTGNEIIQSSVTAQSNIFEINPMRKRLDVNNKLTEEEATSEMLKLVCLSPDAGRVMLAYKLGYFMRQAYVDAGRPPKCCIYLYGRTGTQKTTFSSLLIQTYNRCDEIMNQPRLDASIPAIVRILLENFNDVVIFDDLCPAVSKKVSKQMEETLIQIVRYIADGTTPARMRGNKLSLESPQCGVVFTGEYVIGTGSDAARMLSVEMAKPDGEKLKYFQDHPINVSTFYYHFISWFIDCYDKIYAYLKEMWEKYEKTNLGVHDRLREMHFFLNTAYYLFLQYSFNKGFLSKSAADKFYNDFNNLLGMLIKRQNKRVQTEMQERFDDTDYLGKIRQLYNGKQFRIADDIDHFDSRQDDGVLHGNCLYLRGQCFSKFFPNIVASEIASELKRKGFLQTGKDKLTKQISKLGGMRFYVIPLSKF